MDGRHYGLGHRRALRSADAQAFGSPGANLNPAITLSTAISSGDYSHLLSLWSAQMLGAICGAAFMALHYAPHWSITPDPAAKLGVFCTNGAVHHPISNFVGEVIGTMVLVVVAGSIFSHGVSNSGPAAGMGQWLVGSLVWGIGLSLGGTTGYAINPARDLGPRLAHALLPIPGKGGSNWSYAAIPVLGPLTGGVLAGAAPALCATLSRHEFALGISCLERARIHSLLKTRRTHCFVTRAWLKPGRKYTKMGVGL